jgi:hypothetical protein
VRKGVTRISLENSPLETPKPFPMFQLLLFRIAAIA